MIRTAVLAASLALAVADPARAAQWTMEAAASRLEFAATFEKAAATGVFRTFDARLRFDADKPAEGQLEVTIAVDSADMNSADGQSATKSKPSTP